MIQEKDILSKVFRDARTHQHISGIIARHLDTSVDIRDQALDGLALDHVVNILDLGCGFGFFTEALRNRVHPDALITGIDRFPEYEWFYFQASSRAGIRAHFKSNGIDIIKELPTASYDLVICSYALYFFPEYIHEIARLLTPEGTFVTITHALPHMGEFCTYVKGILNENGLIVPNDLPYETLIANFSDQNGKELLSECFSEIRTIRYMAGLTFGPGDHEALIDYFNFKHHFFIPQDIDPADRLHRRVVKRLQKDLQAAKGMRVSKNDVIFVCSAPKHPVK